MWCCDTMTAGLEYRLPGVLREGSLFAPKVVSKAVGWGPKTSKQTKQQPRQKHQLPREMMQPMNPCNCLHFAHDYSVKETRNSLTMLRLSVEQHLSFLDSVRGHGDDVTISATLAPTPQWPRPAHDACKQQKRQKNKQKQKKKRQTLLAKIKCQLLRAENEAACS